MSFSRTRASRPSGFTLVEVVVALAIIALVAVVLLDKRVEVVRDAAKTRDQRMAWTLAAWKMGEIERDERLFGTSGEVNAGTFEDLSPEYMDFGWDYDARREEVPTNDPADAEEKPKEIFRVVLKVRRGDEATLVEIHGMFPVVEPEAPK